MICKFALLGTLLLASSVLAVHSQPGVPLDHRGDNLQSNDEGDEVDTVWNYGLAGSRLIGETFHHVTATFTIPNLTGSDGAALIATALDTGCVTGSIAVGIQGKISSSEVEWVAWCQWLPAPRVNLNVSITTGNVITVNVDATSTTSGSVVVVNWTNGGVDLHNFNKTDSNSLCLMDAGWGVQVVVDERGKFVPLANFGNMTFINAMAVADGSYDTYLPFGPSMYTLYGIKQDMVTLASVHGNKSTLVVQYVESE